jgi:diguanylate cyclase (GGDEF)-like protein/PAS domain S-box-containing protein
MTSSPRTQVDVQPSATDELFWALYRIKSAGAGGGRHLSLAEGVEVEPALARKVTEFWSDGGTSFEELAVLAHWSGANFEVQPTMLFERMQETLATASFRRLGLSSNRPDERAVLENRIQRLAGDPALAASYGDLLRAVWKAIEPAWASTGLNSVLAACEEWRVRAATGVPLLDLLPRDHAVFIMGLAPLVAAASERGEVVVTPCYFTKRGHVLDLAGLLSVGVPARRLQLPSHFVTEGRRAADFSRLVGQPTRGAILTMLAAGPATAAAISSELGRSPQTIRHHCRLLRVAGLIAPTRLTPPVEFRVVPNAVDMVLNEVSSRLQRNHGRSTRLHADEISADASFHAIFDQAPIAMLQLDLEGRCVSCNGAAQRMFAYTEGEMCQLRGAHLLAEEADHGALDVSSDTVNGQGHRDVRLRKKDGTIFWSSVTLSMVRDDDGRPRFGYAMIEEVSERRGGEDLVTGLPNRALFTTRLERRLALDRRADDGVAVLVVDLDGFKAVNDTLGHEAGDEVLRQAGSRLAASLRATDIVGRLGGDEFGVIPKGALSAQNAALAAEKIRAALREPFVLSDGGTASVDASVGFAISPQDGRTSGELFRRADAVMYAAKRTRPRYLLPDRPLEGLAMLGAT